MKIEIEFLRIISAFGIIYFHSGVEIGREIAYGGLIFFTSISTYFATLSKSKRNLLFRVKRLIIPYFIYSILYGVYNLIVEGVFIPTQDNRNSILLATPSIHLWFLPFIFIALITIDYFRSFILKKWGATLVGIFAIILILLSPIWREFDYISPYGQYAHATPALLIGIFLGGSKNNFVKSIIFAGIILSILIIVCKQIPYVGITYLTGILPLCFLFNSNDKKYKQDENSFIIHISSTTFGVYLIHPLIIKTLKHLKMADVGLPVTTFVISVTIILLIKKIIPEQIVKYIA